MKRFEDIYRGKETCTVAFVGGSITQAGYYDYEIRYPKEFVRRMNERVPETEFTECNAATGGTPSALGMFKLHHDVLDHNPDFLFMEYSVNDGCSEGMLKYYEGLIREALRWNPELPIVIIFAYARSIVKDTSREEPAKVYRLHKTIADAYGIPCIDVAYEFADYAAAREDGDKSITQDGIHPNDAGHTLYADIIMKHIFDLDFGNIRMPEKPLCGYEFNNPRLIPCENMELPAPWNVGNKMLYQSTLRYAYADEAGAELSCEFEGTACGIYLRKEKDGGFADVYIDGEYKKMTAFWDKYCLDFDRNAFDLFTDGLPYGKHTVKIVIRADRDPRSEGHTARVAAFLVG